MSQNLEVLFDKNKGYLSLQDAGINVPVAFLREEHVEWVKTGGLLIYNSHQSEIVKTLDRIYGAGQWSGVFREATQAEISSWHKRVTLYLKNIQAP